VGRPRLLLAEDHARMAEELRGLLATEFDVVAMLYTFFGGDGT
jgi:hypothetical protein